MNARKAVRLVTFLLGSALVLSFAFLAGTIESKLIRSHESDDGFASSTPSVPAAGTSLPESYQWYPVSKVVDGDTIAIRVGDKNVTVRLIDLDTPESVDPRRPVECFGKESAEEMQKLLGYAYVRIETDESQGMYDKYGRLLAYVYMPTSSRREGALLNRYMIAEGYGYEYTFNLPYKYQEEFKSAEVSARELKKGLWADGACDE